MSEVLGGILTVECEMVTAGWGSSLSVSPTTRNFYFCSRFFPRNWQKELSCELAVLQSDIPSADDLIPKIEQELGSAAALYSAF